MMKYPTPVIILLSLTAIGPALAQQQPAPALPFVSPLFGDGMVLQRDRPDPIWGWTKPGATVTVTVEGRTAVATAAGDGSWKAVLPRLRVGGPIDVTVTGLLPGGGDGPPFPLRSKAGLQTITFHNVLVGDVWVCSGQSNMEFGVGNLSDPDTEINQANYPQIRLFQVVKASSISPVATVGDGGGWQVCTPDSVRNDGDWGGFSAVAYFFGRDLHENLHVPIGLIHTSWGGTPAEAWTSEDQLARLSDFHGAVTQIEAARKSADAGRSYASNQNDPAVLYNGMIAPLIPYGIKGAIWYQGESNAGRALQYQSLLPAMIQDWRGRWGEGNFPFLIVQLAGWEPGGASWPPLREAQWLTAVNNRNVGIAAAIDIGDETDIHPKNKQEVGRRLALVAEEHVYRENVESSGPVYASMTTVGRMIRLTFDHLGGGLVGVPNRPALTGFSIADADQKFVDAVATIDGDTVLVSSPDVPSPVAVRYAWSGFPDCSLYNKAGLPAFPFRTDDWPDAN